MVTRKDFQTAVEMVQKRYREERSALLSFGGEKRSLSLDPSAWSTHAVREENLFVDFFSRVNPRFDEKKFRAACRQGL